MSGTLIIGAGGHAKVVADILLSAHRNVIGFLDDEPAYWGTTLLGLPVLGGIEDFDKFKPDNMVIGVGSNKARKEITHRLGVEAEELWGAAIHPTAVIASSAIVGPGTVILAQAVINAEAIIGNHVIVNTAATIDHDCKIANYVHLAPGVHLAGNVSIGEGTLIGIGACAIPGSSVGEWSIIGAGATIIDSIPNNVTAKNTPARW